MGRLQRLGMHFFRAWGEAARRFPPATLNRISQRIAGWEVSHAGETVLAVESRLSPATVWRGVSPRQRALEAFTELEVWDTQHDSGVLIYVLLAERAIEIVVDRGVAARVDHESWGQICATAAQHFSRGEYEAGVMAAVDAVNTLLREHFPVSGGSRNANELDNAPVLR